MKQEMPVNERNSVDAMILRLKSEGLSFRKISLELRLSVGSVTGRYYRLMGVRFPSQAEREMRRKRSRLMRRIARNKERSSAAIQAAIDLREGFAFSVAVGNARSKGASLEMIGACLGVSKQALHKQWQQDQQSNPRRSGGRGVVRRWIEAGET